VAPPASSAPGVERTEPGGPADLEEEVSVDDGELLDEE